MNISDIVSEMTVGMARTNRYSVIMNTPSFLNTEGLMPWRTVLLFCDQIQLPGLNVNTSPNRIFGETRETPYEFNYEPINLSFLIYSGLHVKSYFDEWIKGIQWGDNRNYRYYKQYIAPQMSILVQDLMDQSRYQINLYEVYPKTVSAIQMDYSSKDIMKLNVTLTYKYWKSAPVTKGMTSERTGKSIGNGNDTTLATRGLGGGFIPAIDIFNNDNADLYDVIEMPNDYVENFDTFQNDLADNITDWFNDDFSSDTLATRSQGIETDAEDFPDWT